MCPKHGTGSRLSGVSIATHRPAESDQSQQPVNNSNSKVRHVRVGRGEGGESVLKPSLQNKTDGEPAAGICPTAGVFGARIAVHEVTHRVVFVSYRGGQGGYNKGKHCEQQVNARSLREGLGSCMVPANYVCRGPPELHQYLLQY